ncbi:hypothetical protein MVEN_01826700 [Mycena venus]|uniref:Uncharacterized protein n=1 Tax=Mycena venus TaxID=2733690 RepID=A0A8H6XIY5_9AGAR|nr:hypothetical protein MVEN_01826700 [Mycena venus]
MGCSTRRNTVRFQLPAMPRADTTPTRRTKRDARKPVTQKLARTAASVRAAAMANMSAGGSISAPIIKREAVPTPIPPAVSAKMPVSSPQRGWRHPDELAYIKSAGKTWDDMAIIRFAATNAAFSVPPRGTNSMEPWVHVRLCVDGSEVVLPRGYRLPLLWVAKYLWTSVKLVLTADADILQREWDTAKFEILHIARLCATLLSKARAHMDEAGVMDRAWRCAQFDRALHRYWHDWLIMRDEYLRDFFREFGEDEYRGDVLKLTWSRWVVKGHKGFTLTAAECANGISAEEFMKGLVIDNDAGDIRVEGISTEHTIEGSDGYVRHGNLTGVFQQKPPITMDVPVVQTAAVVASPPAPPQVVSFLVRPRNAFRAARQQSRREAKLNPTSSDEVKLDNVRNDTSTAPVVKEPLTQIQDITPADVTMSVDTTDDLVAQSRDRTRSDVFAHPQQPNGHGDAPCPEAQGQTTPIQGSRESARFPSTNSFDNSTTSTQLTVYPHADQTDSADPGIITRFLQSCGILGEEMRALRSEVAQLRQERDAPVKQLEERVRRLEERAPLPERPTLSVHPLGGGAGRRWSHPLEHLLSPDDSEMDVDAPVGDGMMLTKYGSMDGEPLPPRSRKFNSAQRLPAA